MTTRVPNKMPTKPASRRIALIGEAPGTHEVNWHRCLKCGYGFSTYWRDQNGSHSTDRCTQCFATAIEADPQPFVGPSGWLLNKLLEGAGIDRRACFVGNVCQRQPPGNDITRFKWDGVEMQEGLEQLRSDLAAYQPHFILCLGNTPLRAFKGDRKAGVGDWRGSLFLASDIAAGVKTMAAYHPAALLREAGLTGVTRFDMARAAEESRTDTLLLAVDDIAIDLGVDILLAKLKALREARRPVAVDIEGGVDHVSCIGFADGPNHAFVVPFIKADGTSYWDDPEDEVALWQAVSDVLTDEQVPKRLHNWLYDAFVLAWSYGILIRGPLDDTMVMWFEDHCELEKSLGFITSILTKHPFYKFERKSQEDRVQLLYNGKDCCRTYEVCDKMLPALLPRQLEHYRFNIQLLTPLLFMMLRGMRFDYEKAQERLAATQKRIYALQDRINREAAASRPALQTLYEALESYGAGDVGCNGLVAILRSSFCLARCAEWRLVEETTYSPHHWNGKRWVKKGKRVSQAEVQALVTQGYWQGTNEPGLQAADKPQWWLKPVTKAVKRLVPVAVETLEDVRRFAKDSCKAACRDALKIIGQLFNKGQPEAGRLTPAQRGELATLLGLHVKVNATAAEGDAQWFLYEHCKLPKQFKKEGNKLTDKLASDDEAVIKAWVATKDRRAIWFLNLRQLVTSTKSLAAEPDADGRIRCGYNLVGAETHRLTCYGSPTGSSDLNLQTVTKGHRCLYTADEGCWMAQRDLSASDGCTVAAFAAMLGDTTLMDDNNARLKPAQIMTLMMDGVQVNKLSREQLAPLCKPITEESDWRYFAMKRVQHGGSYMMWKNTMSDQILTDSFKKSGKPIYVPPSKCEEMLVKCFFARYPGIRTWHAWMEREIATKGELRTSDGFVRRFYGRKDDKATVKAALSHLPQYHTTRATMKALHRLWVDPDNRRLDGSLRCEPLHTVHDSLVTQFPKEELEWAKGKLADYFNNSFLIAQSQITIPASGTYGPSWGEQQYQL